MRIQFNFIFQWIKNIVLNKITLGFIIVVLSFLWARTRIESSILNHEITNLRDDKIAFQSLLKTISNLEGVSIDNIVLRSSNRLVTFNEIILNNEYSIMVYQNGVVCNPCLEHITSKWFSSINKFEHELSKELVILSNIFDKSTYNFLVKRGMENFYFIDTNNIINKNIVKSDLPVSFIFFVNKNKIIYSSFFSTNSKENFSNFIKKANRYLKNN